MSTPQTFTSPSQSVDTIRERHITAVNAGDTEAAVGIFAAEGILLPPGQPALEGVPAIRAWFTHIFSQFRIQGFGLQPGAVEQRGGVLIEHGNWKATFQPKDGSPGLPAGGTYLTIYVSLPDGSIRVLRDAFNGLPG